MRINHVRDIRNYQTFLSINPLGSRPKDECCAAEDLIDLVLFVWTYDRPKRFSDKAVVIKSGPSILFVKDEETLWQWDTTGGITRYIASESFKYIVQKSWDIIVDSGLFN
jgi:hypothetical protein